MCPPRPISPIGHICPIKPAMPTALPSTPKRYNLRPKDPFCGLSHLAGAILSAIGPLKAALPAAGVTWLIAGGLFYTIGVIFYATEKPNLWPGKFTAHDLWHVFVLAGSVCHFVMMVGFVGV